MNVIAECRNGLSAIQSVSASDCTGKSDPWANARAQMPKSEAVSLAMKFLERVHIPEQRKNILVNFRVVSNNGSPLPAPLYGATHSVV